MAGWNKAGTGGTSDTSDTSDPALSSAGNLAARRIAANVASIASVPERVLGGVDREWALAWACKGYDVYAFRSDGGAWYLWLATRSVELGAPPVVTLPALRRVNHRRR
jgi:hypothetical protein